MNKHIVEYLDYFNEIQNPQYAVLLIGKWGCGKTYFIKNLIDNWSNSDKNKQEPINTFNPIYVSLNGVSSIKTINDKIRSEINPFLYSKGAKLTKKVIKGLLKSTIKIDIDADDDDNSDGNVSLNIDSLNLLESNSSEIKGKKILIFDDVERCKIEIDEVFGYINNFVEHSACKVILIADEEKIQKRYEEKSNILSVKYNDFKEKLIGQTFEIKSDIINAVKFFITESGKINENSLIKLNSDLIIQLFTSSDLNNLRVLKQALMDFSRLESILFEKFNKHQNYTEYIKNLLTYFIIVYAEHKTGNSDIKLFQEISFLEDNKKKNVKKTEDKYESIILQFNIYNSHIILPIENILTYIDKGYIEKEVLLEKINESHFFRIDKEQDWEKLWGWDDLQDIDFKRLHNNVWNQFSSSEIKQVTILFHVIGIFLSLKENNLTNKTSKQIISLGRKNIRKICQNKTEIRPYYQFNLDDHSWSKGYQSRESAEYNMLYKYFGTLVLKESLKEFDNTLKKMFENLNSENISDIFLKLREYCPQIKSTYENSAIFKNVNGKKLGIQIKKLKNEKIVIFSRFIRLRYNL